MNETVPPPSLTASKIWGRGMSVWSQFRQPKSWFLVRNEWFLRCSDPENTDSCSKKGLSSKQGDALGNTSYWEQEYFGIISTPWSAVAIPQKGLVYRISDSPNYLSITQWLDHCADFHPKCQQQHFLDLQSITLIDIHTRQLVNYPGSEVGDQDCEYVALSYVWGNTIQHTVQKTAFLPKELPRTIQDALTVVEKIGKRYLWVDSICIDQSKPTEKMSQISIMDQIYQGAFATIIVLSGESAHSGIPGVQRRPKRVPQMYADLGKIHLASRMPSLEQELKKSKWMERAWTCQEALLSRRCIIFTAHQVFFSCNKMDCSEGEGRSAEHGGTDLLASNSKLDPLRDPLIYFEDWSWSTKEEAKLGIYNHFISDYTCREMTKDSDSLNAITALLRRMQNTILSKGFLYGLLDFLSMVFWIGRC